MDVARETGNAILCADFKMEILDGVRAEELCLYLLTEDNLVDYLTGIFLVVFQAGILCGGNDALDDGTLGHARGIEHLIVAKGIIPVAIEVEMNEPTPLVIALADKLASQVWIDPLPLGKAFHPVFEGCNKTEPKDVFHLREKILRTPSIENHITFPGAVKQDNLDGVQVCGMEPVLGGDVDRRLLIHPFENLPVKTVLGSKLRNL